MSRRISVSLVTCHLSLVTMLMCAQAGTAWAYRRFDGKSHEVSGRKVPPTPTDLRDDGVVVANGHTFGRVNALTVIVAQDSTLEHVRLEYSRDGVTWTVIGRDFDTRDTTFAVEWDTQTLPVASDYRIRAIAHDSGGEDAGGPAFINCQITR